MSSLPAMWDSMRLSATGRWKASLAATARWTCAMPPTPSCSYTMYGPNSSVGEPSLTQEAYQGSRSLRPERRLRMRVVTGHGPSGPTGQRYRARADGTTVRWTRRRVATGIASCTAAGIQRTRMWKLYAWWAAVDAIGHAAASAAGPATRAYTVARRRR